MFEKVSLFEGLAAADLADLSAQATTRQYRRSTLIINEGDESDSLYVVISGRLKVYRSDEQGKEIILGFLGPGESFGELALLDQAPRSASVETQETTQLASISQRAFYGFLESHPMVALNLVRSLAQRVRQLTDSIADLALLDVYGRVARVLLKEAKQEDGQLITDKLTHQDIADMVGASREMVSKIVKELKTGGYISIEEKRILIHDRLPARW